jgi:hypothetical protein
MSNGRGMALCKCHCQALMAWELTFGFHNVWGIPSIAEKLLLEKDCALFVCTLIRGGCGANIDSFELNGSMSRFPASHLLL